MTWTFAAAIVAAVFAVGAVTGSKYATDVAQDEAIALYEANQKATQRRLDAVDAAAALHEADKVRTAEMFASVERMVSDVKKTGFYAAGNLCLDDAGVRIINRSPAPAAAPTRQPAPAVPAPAPARQR